MERAVEMSNLRVVERGELARGAWDATAAASGEAWLWHLEAVIQALCTWPRYSDASFAVLAADGMPAAIVPLHVVADRMLGVVPACRLVSTGGPALAPSLSGRQRREVHEAIVAALDDRIGRHRASWAEASLSALTPVLNEAPANAANPLIEAGFQDRSQTTWVVDLHSGEDEIRRGYSQLTRRALRKAAETAFSLREASSAADLDTYFALHGETCARTGASPLPFAYFEQIFTRLVPEGRSRILLLERAGVVVAAQNTGLWKTGAVYWSGASRDDREGGDNRLLFDAQILHAKAAGSRLYETGQAYPTSSDGKERGLSEFKRSFGARLARLPAGRRYAKKPIERGIAAFRLARGVARGDPG